MVVPPLSVQDPPEITLQVLVSKQEGCITRSNQRIKERLVREVIFQNFKRKLQFKS